MIRIAVLALLLLFVCPVALAYAEDGDAPPPWSPPSGVPTAPADVREVAPPRDVPSGPPFGELQLGPDSHVPGGDAEYPAEETIEEILARVRTENAVLFVRKKHDQPWHGVWTALELDMLFHVYGQAGRSIGASVTFYSTRTNQPLRARMEPYVDGDGNVSIYTKIIPMAENSKLLRTKLKIPYRAFPWPTSNREYEVQARVRLLRREPNGSVTALARGTTTFKITVLQDCMECVPARIADCPPPSETRRRLDHDVQGLFGEQLDWLDAGVISANRPAVDPPSESQWYQAKWRTRIARERAECLREYDENNRVCRGTPCPPVPTPPKPSVTPTVRTYQQPGGWGWSHQRGRQPPPPSAPAPGSTR